MILDSLSPEARRRFDRAFEEAKYVYETDVRVSDRVIDGRTARKTAVFVFTKTIGRVGFQSVSQQLGQRGVSPDLRVEIALEFLEELIDLLAPHINPHDILGFPQVTSANPGEKWPAFNNFARKVIGGKLLDLPEWRILLGRAPFPERAEFLTQAFEEQGRPKIGDLDLRTLKRALEGERVNEDTLKAIAKGLKFSRSHIPDR